MHSQHQFQLLQDDPYLRPFENYYVKIRQLIDQKLSEFQAQGGLDIVSQSYKRYGLHRTKEGFTYEEWAPGAKSISIFGDFNHWKRGHLFCHKNQFGHWKCDINSQIPQFSAIKVDVQLSNGQHEDRIPAWMNYTRQNKDNSFDGVFIQLGKYIWKNPKPKWSNQGLSIYQCHIGMSGSEQKVHSFDYFRHNVLPRIKQLGYKAIQIMGVIEHPYYGSFGYHCSSFFSVSSRLGTPQDFKRLVDDAHGMGIKIVIDLVHSHAAKNVNEGINMWDGTDYQYFHGGQKGNHPLWDSRVFDYSKYQVLRFWLQEYNTDGFRFDGVTSMLYQHHGKNFAFSGNYNQYFNQQLDLNAICYLSIANQLAKQIYPDVILIGEDVSGFPGLCRSIEDGGIGFGFRLSMAIPDMWISLIKETKDQEWNIGDIAFKLTNTRDKEKCIAYAESHDQALVGDKTLSMWLFDSQIYSNMSVFSDETLKIFRGMALHKMIRLISFSLGNNGYLNFMGNQFGHPEWIDFPREGNNWSYKYCRRQWDLADRTDLRYHHLYQFDKQMLQLDQKYQILASTHQYVRINHAEDKVLIYERGSLLFIFNWNPTKSYQKYLIECKWASRAKFILTSDDKQVGGHSRVTHQSYELQKINNDIGSFFLYIPSRCTIVFHLEND